MADVIWLHEEALRLTHPVFAAAAAGAGCVYVWDAVRLTQSHVGVKRQLFIYETLAEMASSCGLEIHEGKAEEVLPQIAGLAGADRILVPASPDPAILVAIAGLRRAAPQIEVIVVEDTPFATLTSQPDLGRFFRYWNKAKKSALRPQGI
ncbi:MAG: deoxyribodipyrimidine photo-lyase [Candidatus Puniceispirillaceae bacterium]